MVKCEIYRDHFQNARRYNIPPGDCIIADIPFNIGQNFNASRPSWYEGNRIENGESSKAHKAAFKTDYSFSIPDFFAFATRLLKKEPAKGEKGAPCMIVFCAFEQIGEVIAEGEKAGFKKYQHLTLIKKSSAQVLKANMRICGATEHALVLYRQKLPKFNNVGEDGEKHMILDWFEFVRDGREIPRIHPTQKPVNLLKRLISIFTDPGDTVIDVCAGSGSTLRAARELGRNSYGFEIDREFYQKAREEMLSETIPSNSKNVVANDILLFSDSYLPENSTILLPADPLLPEDILLLWNMFGDVPVNDADEIEEPFMSFPAGTDRMKVWQWFDERWPGGIAALIG